MFIGHYSTAFIAKRIAPAISLPIWFVACQAIDLLWGSLVLLGVEKLHVIPHFTASNAFDLYFMPYTHSLPATIGWSLATALLFWLFSPSTFPQRTRTAVVLGLVVASHWLLDLVVHIPDLPLWFDSEKVGMGLWNYRYPALLLELGLLWIGIWLSLTVAAENRGRYLLLGTGMSVVQLLSLVLQPPTDMQVASNLLFSSLLLTAAAYWAGKPQRTSAACRQASP